MSDLENYLQDLEEQTFKEERDIILAKNPVVDLLCKYYRPWSRSGDFSYKQASVLTKKMKYTSKDIRVFSILLKKYEEDSDYFSGAGHFLSALINNSEGKTFEIFTSHLNIALDWIGSYNNKKITVIGNLGDCTGYCMQPEGELHVNGKIRQVYGLCEGKVFQNGKQINLPQWSK